MLPEIPWIHMPTFNIMVMIASLTGTFYAYYQAKKKGLSQIAVLDIGIVGTIAGIVGARLFHVFLEQWPKYQADPWLILRLDKGGVVSFGAILGIGIAVPLYLRIKKLNILKYLDLLALTFPIIIFFVRIGCLSAGCCYGKPTHSFFHLVFHIPHSPPAKDNLLNTPLHPTQIYDMMNATFLFFMLHLIDRKKKFDGQVVWTFLMGYAFIRGIIEFFRADTERGLYHPFGIQLSTGQFVSIGAIVLGFILYQYSRIRFKNAHSRN